MTRAALPDGGWLAYDVRGNGPPLLLVAGLGGLGRFWAPHLDAFARHFTVITYDHRGTGASSHDRIDYSIAQMADDVCGLLDAAGHGPVHLLGHSTGGAIGQHLAAHHPQRVQRLVLSGTWCAPDPYVESFFRLRTQVLRDSGREAHATLAGLLAFPPRWVREHGPPDPARAVDQVPDEDIMASRIEALVRFDGRDLLARIRQPTLVLAARDDMIIPAYLADALRDGIAGARHALVDEGGHFFPVSQPQWFREQVLGFLLAP